MSLVFNNKRIGFNGKRLIGSKADDPGLPDPGDNPGGWEIG